jgi:hypothetical protein
LVAADEPVDEAEGAQCGEPVPAGDGAGEQDGGELVGGEGGVFV